MEVISVWFDDSLGRDATVAMSDVAALPSADGAYARPEAASRSLPVRCVDIATQQKQVSLNIAICRKRVEITAAQYRIHKC